VRWLYTRAWLSSEQPSVLFDLATARLVEQQVLLPGVSILARLVVRIRERANTRLYRKLARKPSAEQRDQLKELLVVPAGARRSTLDRLRRGPTQPTSGRNSTLARALGEYGRIGKTLHLLDLADDELYRRSLLIQVNKGERRHGLARTVFHGRGGELRQAYREGQEDQLGALGLVLNAIVLWNTRYMGLALDELRAMGMRIQPEDVERLSPLIHHHIHLDGRYSFSLPAPLAQGQLRPLRDPNDPAEQVFDLVAATA